MPVNTITPAGDSASAALHKTGSDWTTVIGAASAASVADLGTTDGMFQCRLNSGTFTNRRGYMYFDLAASGIPKKAQFIKLKKARLKLTFSSVGGTQANGKKFRIYAMNPTSAGFNPHVDDYNNYLSTVFSDTFEATAAEELTFEITNSRLLRWLERKIRRRSELHLMVRGYNDVGDVDPTGNNRALYRSSTYGTASERPKLVIQYTVDGSRKAAGGGFAVGDVVSASRNGFGRF